MAIEFNCPHCLYPYKLKDEFAGKRATCKNPDCRQVIVIPKPVTVPEDQMPSAAELEAAALSALNDEPAKPQEQEPAEKVIEMTCNYCEHKWTEPLSKAGKNTLCPNPECRQRMKVPEPKVEKQDWREARSRIPSGAKIEKLEGVEDAAEARTVAGESLRKAGATGIEIEPRTLKEKAVIVFTVAALITGLAVGIWYLTRSRTNALDDRLMAEARSTFDQSKGELEPAQVGLCSAVLNMSGAEYALRHNTAEKLKEAHNFYLNARKDLENQAGAEKNAVAAELALAVTSLGGSDEQVKEQIRFRWQPDLSTGRLKMNERTHTVHDELRLSLALLQGADFDYRITVARRLTRELFKKGKPALAADTLPLALFGEAEKDEARAVIALELLRLDKGSDVAQRIAQELKTKVTDSLKGDIKGAFWGNPYAPSTYTLFAALPEKISIPRFGEALPRTPELNDSTRLAHVGIALMDNFAEDAVKLALRPKSPESQLKSLLLCAEWLPNPGSPVDEAVKLVNAVKGKRDVNLSQSQILRLAQIAAANGFTEQARALTAALSDEGMKVWASGDAIRLRLAANPREKTEVAALELPEEPKHLKVGHAWGVLWVARRNAEDSGDRNKEKQATANWMLPLRPFGLAGIALGLGDR